MKKRVAKPKDAADVRIPLTLYVDKLELERLEAVRGNFGPVKPAMAFFLKTLIFQSVERREMAAVGK